MLPSIEQVKENLRISLETTSSKEYRDCIDSFRAIATAYVSGQLVPVMSEAELYDIVHKHTPVIYTADEVELAKALLGKLGKVEATGNLCPSVFRADIKSTEVEAREVCEWKEDSDGNWETSCDDLFVLTEGTPSMNNMKYCPMCGKSVKEIATGKER